MYMQSIEEECAIDINKKIEHPPIAIGFKTNKVAFKDGNVKEFPTAICTYGNFSFVQAPPKSMKTFFVSLLGSAFCNPNGSFTKGMSSFREDKHFVHFDTEQGEWHSQRVFKRIEWMNKGLNLDFYHTFALRKIGYKDRIDFIQYYLDCMREEGKEIGLVVIDGIADFKPRLDKDHDSNIYRVWISAHTGEGIDLLYQALSQSLSGMMTFAGIKLDVQSAYIRSEIHKVGFIQKEIMNEFGQWLLEINVTRHYLERLLDKQGVSLLWEQKSSQSQTA